MATMKDMKGPDERRRYMRFRLNYQVSITHDGITTDGELRDMSLNGIFVNTSLKVPLNEDVEVTIFDHARPLHRCNLKATVARATPTGLGLMLEKMLLER